MNHQSLPMEKLSGWCLLSQPLFYIEFLMNFERGLSFYFKHLKKHKIYLTGSYYRLI